MDWAQQSNDLSEFEGELLPTLSQRLGMGSNGNWIGNNTLLLLNDPIAPVSYQKSHGASAIESLFTSDSNKPVNPTPINLTQLAYHQMLYEQQDQTILLLGESGSGKSSTRKLITHELISLSRNGKKKSKVLSGGIKMESALEAFGHAKTTSGSNASGFGRFVEYQYDNTGRMIGLKLMDYGLDIKRVTSGHQLPQGERTFHIFYQLFFLSAEEKENLHLHDPNGFSYLRGTNVRGAAGNGTMSRLTSLSRRASTRKSFIASGNANNADKPTQQDVTYGSEDSHLPTQKDESNFAELREHLKSLGMGRRTQGQIFRVLAAILHLGNIVFLDDLDSHDDPCDIKNPESLHFAAELLDVSPSLLKQTLTYRSRWVSRELCSVQLKAAEAVRHRDDLAQTLYSLLFSWLVEHINERLCKSEEEIETLIGIVDFPWFKTELTSGLPAEFSTLVSNYAQERIVSFTNTSLFEEPGFILNNQGIDITAPYFSDNLWAIDLFRGSPRQQGLFSILDKAVQGTRPSHFCQDLVESMDKELKQNPQYVVSSKCTSGITTIPDGRAKAIFGIRHHHHGPCVEYDLDQFVSQSTVVSDFVALFRGSASVLDPSESNAAPTSFVAELFSRKTGLSAQISQRGTVVGTTKSQQPLRQPSMKRKKSIKGPTASEETLKNKGKKGEKESESSLELHRTEFDTLMQAMNDLMENIKLTQCWFIFCVRMSNPNTDRGRFDPALVQGQLALFSIPELIQFRKRLDVDVNNGMTYYNFVEKYSSLIATKGASRGASSPRDMVQQFISSQWWPAREISLGTDQIFLSGTRWRWMEAALRRIESADTSDDAKRDSHRFSGMYVPQQMSAGISPGYEQGYLDQQMYAPGALDGEEEEDEYHSETRSNYSSEFKYGTDTKITPRSASRKMDMETGYAATNPSSIKEKLANEHVESVSKITPARRCWVCCTWSLTWWIPSFCLSICGGMKRPDIRMAWREKVALCIIIASMCAALLFFIVGLRFVICPPSKIRSQAEVLSMSRDRNIPWVTAHGRYYYIQPLVDRHSKDYGRDVESTMSTYYGRDVSSMFYRQDRFTDYCPGLPTPPDGWDYLDPTVDWMVRPTTVLRGMHRNNYTNGRPIRYVEMLASMAQGPVGWTTSSIRTMVSRGRNVVIIYNNVYFVNGVFAATNTFPEQVRTLFQAGSGQDVTRQWKALRAANQRVTDQLLTCMNNLMYIGTVDNRDTIQCRFSNWILLSASIVLVAVIGIKFLAALQFSRRKTPEEPDKFVICMVPCYTEGADSLSRTFESLATTTYDDKRKLIFVICDGMIVGSGNDRPTPQIVLDILGVDPTADPEPVAFQSLGEGNRQFNMGKIYSGLYEIKGHSVPFVVVVKCGSRTERVKPGNRGKRDSQLVLMRFLSRVHFNAEFCHLELEIFHHMKNIIGVSPAFYEFVLMVDADTEVEPMSLNSMVSVMVHNTKIMGLCGETRISNEKGSWVTAIQVYEYFISHHLAKAFESLFGTVTCLPGCFSMYRIRTAAKNVPILANPALLADYGVNTVDTLHMKNLLHLGEDRYLTTLMLKHFPHFSTKFTPEAKCLTVAPERWAVLLSQRRRWINSTVHNLFELMFLDQLCGFCCFSMRFIVFLDLFATFVQPATVLYIAYLIYATATSSEQFPLLSIILIGAIYGFQVVIFFLKREWSHVVWMIIYILAIPVFSFWIPCYAFWHFDDFSWGNTRVVVGEGKKTVYIADAEPFDPTSIPLKRWRDYEENDLWERGSMVSGSSFKTGSSRHDPRRASWLTTTTGTGMPPRGYASSEYSSVMGGPTGAPSVASGYAPSFAPSYAGSVAGGPRFSPAGLNGMPNMVMAPGPGSPAGLPPRMGSLGNGSQDWTGGSPRASVAGNGRPASPIVPGPFPSSVTADTLSDDMLAAEIKKILATADMMTVTKKQIREELGKRFGVDLKSRREDVNRVVDAILQGKL